ncbi:glycoside hydrolase family 26 protein [Flexithrix dorotheae]|uniref:glycoside hydrolase family 26 protein n=1 Tax=Flexithrix dorotheae TaxID=70993 RepID=UPI000368C65D|nr:glycosyl hydrolase [Flexithrix dorotheae]
MKWKFQPINILLFSFFCFPSMGQLKLVDTKATKQTKALYTNLHYLSKKAVLFGHQDDLAYGIGWKNEPGRSDIKEVCGDYPAVYGWELSKIGAPMNIDSVDFKNMIEWIKESYQRGGINTISWHLDNLKTGGNSWDNTPSVKEILPGGSAHQLYLDKLDLFVDFIKKLKVRGQKIPILFRPFHEHTGNWFWWGAKHCSPEEYIALWQFTVKYLRDENKLHNLIYVYATDVFKNKEHYLERYPGDDFVDVLAYDDYHHIKSKKGTDKLAERLTMLVEMAEERGKFAALSETGLETVSIENWWTDILLDGIQKSETGSQIAYVMVWRNGYPGHYYAPYPGHKCAPDFVKFKQSPFTLFESDLPNMYKMPKL